MEFDLARSVAPLALVIAVGAAALAVSTPMDATTVGMMVLPSMVVFGAVAFGLGVKHGEFRAS